MNRFLPAIALSIVTTVAAPAYAGPADPAGPAAVPGAEAIRPFGPDSFRQIVAQGKDRPLVVLVWSLDCTYCLPSFEALAAAKKTHDLEVITIATDPVDDPEAARLIAKKLSTSGLNGNAWAFGPWPPEQLRYTIDPRWRGELPRSYWFGADGKATAHSGLISAAIVEKRLAK